MIVVEYERAKGDWIRVGAVAHRDTAEKIIAAIILNAVTLAATATDRARYRTRDTDEEAP